MKRLVVGLLLAATAYAPFGASAQRRDYGGPATTDVDRQERQERRAERLERRAERLESGAAVEAPTPSVDRPRRDRDGDGLPDRRRDRAEIGRPDMDIDREPRPDRIDPVPVERPGRADGGFRRSDRRDQQVVRSTGDVDPADYQTDLRNGRRDRSENRPDLRRDELGRRRDRFDNRGGLRNDRRFDDRDGDRLGDRDRFQDRRGDRRFDGRSVDPYRGGQVWNRGWRNDGRYDWNRARLRNRDAYRLPRYYAPQGAGYGYRRFGLGVQLSRSLFARDYWLNDPYAYRLPPAYGPYRWVRYHGDALLVDLRTGRVIDVVYHIFY
ncbi:RcnB family protein [uncultured Sphingomonas sp.]|uniref:RcnB family protein n=1 Tax=uncultured Sphingomonas sp. TaxID=158754 RepID=UPI0035CA550E